MATHTNKASMVMAHGCPPNLCQDIYNVCWAALQKEISITKLATVLRSMNFSGASVDVLENVFWLLWLEVSSESALRTRLVRCVEEMLKEGLVNRSTLLETGEIELLEEAGIVGTSSDWESRESSVQHLLQYPKRMLFHEEINGYSKLASCLCIMGPLNMNEDASSHVASLIGQFQLEPDRVLACVLDVCEDQLLPSRFLLRRFGAGSIAQVLGFNFQIYQKSGLELPANLLALTASLVQEKIVCIDEVFTHLEPCNEKLAESYCKTWSELHISADKIGVINLASTTMEADRKLYTGNLQLDIDPRYLDDIKIKDLERDNQKIHLLAWFIKIGDMTSMHNMLDLIKPCEIEPGLFPTLCHALCQALHDRLDAVLQRHRVNRFAEKILQNLLPDQVFDLIGLLGIWVYRDIHLIMKVLHAMRLSLQMFPESLSKVATVMEQSVAPAASLLPANPALAGELWDVLSLMPYTSRFKIYSTTQNVAKTQPLVKASSRKAVVEAKRILRRLHIPQDRAEKKKKLKPFGRTLGKIAHSAPIPVMDAIVSQIESFGCNQIGEPLLDSLKYLTPMGFDVMTFVLLDRLTMNPLKRKKIKDDGIHLADWMLNLAQLCGEACKRFNGVDITALCQYVTNQLKQQEGADLQILKEVISQVAGIVTVEDLNESQVEALAGGETLRHETITLSALPKNRKLLHRGARRVLEAIQKGPCDEQLLVPLMILIAQQRNLTITNSPYGMPLKGIGEVYDRCQQTFYQYVELLQTTISNVEDYTKLLPSMEAMHSEYRLDPEVVFALWRPALQAMKQTCSSVEPMSSHLSRESFISWKQVCQAVQLMLPAKTWDAITPELYITFWSYSLYDIYNPSDRYKAEEQRLKALLRQKEVQLADRNREAHYQLREREHSPTDDLSVLKREKRTTEETIERLQVEMQQQAKRVAEVHERLTKDNKSWLQNSTKDENGAVMVFIQHCIVPRVMFSPADALYCCKFSALLHNMGTPYFSSLVYYDKVVKLLVHRVVCITDREAANLGVFLRETLGLLERWRSNREVYDEECASRPGFCVKLGDPSSRKAAFHEFRTLTSRWQSSLTRAFSSALKAEEYTQIRAALLVLVQLVKIPFPAIKRFGRILSNAAKKVAEREQREDLKTLANSYCLQLDQQIKKMPEDDEYGGFRKVQSVAFGEEATAGQMQGMDKSEQIRKIADKLAEPNELTCSSGDHISAQENNEQLAQDHKTSAASFFEVGCTRQGIASTAGNLSSDPTVSNPKTGSDGVRQCSTDIDSERPQKRHKNIEYTKKS